MRTSRLNAMVALILLGLIFLLLPSCADNTISGGTTPGPNPTPTPMPTPTKFRVVIPELRLDGGNNWSYFPETGERVVVEIGWAKSALPNLPDDFSRIHFVIYEMTTPDIRVDAIQTFPDLFQYSMGPNEYYTTFDAGGLPFGDVSIGVDLSLSRSDDPDEIEERFVFIVRWP
jgi:hypothetical protein